MDFETPAAIKPLLSKVRAFTEEEVFPRERELSGKSFKEMEPALERARAKVKAMGLWAPQLPREYGGMGLSLIEHALVSELLGMSPQGRPLQRFHPLCPPAVAAGSAGSAEHRRLAAGPGQGLIQTLLVLQNSKIPSRPSSRP